MSSTRSFDWNLESLNIWTNCQFIWSGKMYIWLSVWEFKKLYRWQPCLNKLMHVDNWNTDHFQRHLYVDISYKFTLAWFFVSHACAQITINTFISDWYFYSGNSVLTRVPHIQLSRVMITFIILLNCILNVIAWDQAPQWGKRKKRGQIGKISHC